MPSLHGQAFGMVGGQAAYLSDFYLEESSISVEHIRLMKVTRVIVPAAGRGTRLKSAGSSEPKEWLRLGGKPMISHALEEIGRSNLTEVVLVLSPSKLQYWKNSCSDPDFVRTIRSLTVEIVVQPAPVGLADAIDRGRPLLGTEPFAIVLPDNILFSTSSPALGRLMQAFELLGKYVTGLTFLSSGREVHFSNSGRVDVSHLHGQLYEIREWYPKSEGHFMLRRAHGEIRSVGRHVVPSSFFEHLDGVRGDVRGEFDDWAVMRKMIQKDRMFGVLLDDEIFDVGNLVGFEALKQRLESAGS